MMKIYLDFNVIVYIKKGNNLKLNEIVMNKKRGGNVFMFSPAHLEELAVSEKIEKTPEKIINDDLNFLTELCENHSIKKISKDYVEFDTEYPRECYERVIRYYNLNASIESIEQAVVDDIYDRPAGDPREMNNCDPVDLFSNIMNMEILLKYLMSEGAITQSEAIHCLQRQNYEIVINKFFALQLSVTYLANWLEKIGYYREARKNARSRTHDVSHIIYGSYSDIFVSNDNKLIKKISTIYKILGIATKTALMESFIEQNS